MPTNFPKHRVFVSFHERDIAYKERFVAMMRDYMVDESVDTGDIMGSNLPLDEVRRRIRDDYIADATVTVVLIGPCTWQRKHVDWEISSSLRRTRNNPRCGLLGVRLPIHTDFRDPNHNLRLLPPRLADNCVGNDPYARVHRWSGSRNQVHSVRGWIHQAFERRNGTAPVNNRPQFGQNRQGNCAVGWRD